MEIYDDIVKINWTVYDQKRGGKQLCSSRGMFHACLIIGYFGKPIDHLTCLKVLLKETQLL